MAHYLHFPIPPSYASICSPTYYLGVDFQSPTDGWTNPAVDECSSEN
ncbi:hypothetical protein ACHAXM_002004, partial [Skeletonema potamos]